MVAATTVCCARRHSSGVPYCGPAPIVPPARRPVAPHSTTPPPTSTTPHPNALRAPPQPRSSGFRVRSISLAHKHANTPTASDMCDGRGELNRREPWRCKSTMTFRLNAVSVRNSGQWVCTALHRAQKNKERRPWSLPRLHNPTARRTAAAPWLFAKRGWRAIVACRRVPGT